jgi:hypothetical protein
MLERVRAKAKLLSEKLDIFASLNMFAIVRNGLDWSAKTALANAKSVYIIRYDYRDDAFVVLEADGLSDLLDIMCTPFAREADAQEYIDKNEKDLRVLISEIQSEEFEDDEAYKEFEDDEDTEDGEKALTKEDVSAATSLLIDATGSTTTLAVKQQLRSEGFDARQAEVSNFMQEVMHDLNLRVQAQVTNGNTHLVFTK